MDETTVIEYSMDNDLHINSSVFNNTKVFETTEEMIDELLREHQYFVIVLYFCIFVTAILSNLVVIIVYYKFIHIRNTTTAFILNLSIADLMVATVSMPNAAWMAYTSKYIFGNFICVMSLFLQCVSIASSIFTITLIAIDRYLAISRPFNLIRGGYSRRIVTTVVFGIWVFAGILFVPILQVGGLSPTTYGNNITIYMCSEQWEHYAISQQIMSIIWFLFMFLIPGSLMFIAYTLMGRTLCLIAPPADNYHGPHIQIEQRNRIIRERKRIALTLLVLFVVFVICWMPYHILYIIEDTGTIKDTHSIEAVKKIKRYLLLLGHSNSAINPILYCAMSKNIRGCVERLLGKFRTNFRRSARLQSLGSSRSCRTNYSTYYFANFQNGRSVSLNT